MGKRAIRRDRVSAHWAAAAIVLTLCGFSAVLIFEQRAAEKNRDVKGFADRYNREHPKKRRQH